MYFAHKQGFQAEILRLGLMAPPSSSQPHARIVCRGENRRGEELDDMDHGLGIMIKIKVTDISTMRVEMIELYSGDTVGVLKRRIEARGMGLAVDQRLAFAGRVLGNDEQTLGDAGIEGMCAVILALKRFCDPVPTLFCSNQISTQGGMKKEFSAQATNIHKPTSPTTS